MLKCFKTLNPVKGQGETIGSTGEIPIYILRKMLPAPMRRLGLSEGFETVY